MLRKEFEEAAIDYFYLLSRGYNSSSALDLVTARYQLTKFERLALYRSIYPPEVAELRRSKTLLPRQVRGEELIIDGFNVLTVVSSALMGEQLLLGVDGFVRDLSSLRRKVKVTPVLLSSLSITVMALARLKPSEVTFVFDSQISRSALASTTAKDLLRNFDVKGTAILVRKADKTSIELKGVVCSADSVILDRAERLFDLGGYLANIISPENIFSLHVHG